MEKKKENKKQIYYARTYRRLQIKKTPGMILSFMGILTAVVMFVWNISALTNRLTDLAVRILSGALPAEQITICTGGYSIFGSITYISLQAADVSRRMIGVNFFVCLALFLFMLLLRKSGTPLAIFALFAVLTHMISCVFFWLAGEYFPYTLGEYSELYVKQQIGIWLVFFVLSGLVIVLVGERDYLFKLLMFVAIMGYSFVFGAVRYIFFLYLLHTGSLLYMALLFFVLGPMFDFSYLVAFYAIFINKKTKDYEYGKKRSAWKWS